MNDDTKNSFNKFNKIAVKKIIISLAVLITLIVISDGLSSNIEKMSGSGFQRIEIGFIKETGIPYGNSLSYRDIKDFVSKNRYISISFASELKTYASSNYSAVPVKLQLTDDNFPEFEGIKLLKGAYFTEYSVNTGSSVAIISDRLAYILYKTLDAVGNEIELNGETYKVSGIYESSKSIISFLSNDGYDRVYVPFTSISYYSSMPVQKIFLRNEDFDRQEFEVMKLQSTFAEEYGIGQWDYRINDYYKQSKVLNWLNHIPVFIIGVLSIILLFKIELVFIKKKFASLKATLKDYYFFEAIRKEKLNIAVSLISIVVVAACILFIFYIVRFEPYIPANAIPQDNIFDFQFYRQSLGQMISDVNTSSDYYSSDFACYFFSYARLKAIMFLLTLICIISLVSCFRIVNALFSISLKKGIMILISSVGASLIISLLSIAILAIDFMAAKESIVIVLLFGVLNILRNGTDKLYAGTNCNY